MFRDIAYPHFTTRPLVIVLHNERSHRIRYDKIGEGEFNVDSKAEYSALSSTRSQKKKLKQTTPVPLYTTASMGFMSAPEPEIRGAKVSG